MSLKRKEPMDEYFSLPKLLIFAPPLTVILPKLLHHQPLLITSHRILKSRIITFVIGPEKEQFIAHESSIAGLSEPLRVLVTGNMKEAIEAKVTWEDVEPAVFVSLMEFAYNGNFSTPKSEQQGNRGVEAPDLNEESCANEREDKRDKGDAKDKGDDRDERDDDERHRQGGDSGNLDTCQPTDEDTTLMSCLEEDDDSTWEACANGRFSHKHFRLKHFHQLKDSPSSLDVDIIPYDVKAYIMTAKLYVISDKYDIAALKSLCLYNFTYNLAHISGKEATMDILAATIRYVHAHTMPKDQLRKLLLRFLITDMEWALANDIVRKMLDDIPELASQLILLVPSYYWEELKDGSLLPITIVATEDSYLCETKSFSSGSKGSMAEPGTAGGPAPTSPPRSPEVPEVPEEPVNVPENLPEGAIEPQENLNDEAEGYESASDTVTNASTSLSSSVRDFNFENNRRYHKYKEGRYTFPNDDAEQEREDMKHAMVVSICGGKLHTAPLENPQKILDIGTGTGIWAIDMGDEYPEAEITGIDLSPIQPSYVPPNVHFIVDDVEAEWLYPDNSIDYIHLRHMSPAIRDWTKVLDQAYRVLKPGGWIELQEMWWFYHCDDGTMPEDYALTKMIKLIWDGLEKFGIDRNLPNSYSGRIEEAGFVNQVRDKVKVPFGGWPKRPDLRMIGSYCAAVVYDGLYTINHGPLTKGLGWTTEEVEVFLMEIRKDLLNTSIHSYVHYETVAGQKPRGENV
ncbi:Secondary metabolism regulator LAE1 [Colletotrichum gloeosporioides]|uniref:Secondary metabolism regulator LAE1 n=1 Tax=Colletotrichum gloeosporioides TaxID=474922 RepID=A0A8H4CH90_COLGL|nr:Secondary metabolism regulator LAE1 [Colletotrichum gloeosporioides]KAF3803983.1 Secondary metabolism regulator LAE1 [Colletotrichum gloeosporioides]